MPVQIKRAKDKIKLSTKILLYGPYGSGKTLAALTFPRCLIIDFEGRANEYRGDTVRNQYNIGEFDIANVESLEDVYDVIRQVKQDNGKTWDTLIVDPVSVPYYLFVEKWRKIYGEGNDKKNEYVAAGQDMRTFMAKFTNLPVTVIMIARQADRYAKGKFMTIDTNDPTKPDTDKAIGYWVSYAIEMDKDHSGVVDKQTAINIAKKVGDRVPEVNYNLFKPVLEYYSTGATEDIRTLDVDKQSDKAVDQEANKVKTNSFKTQAEVSAFVERWKHLGDAKHILSLISDKKSFREIDMSISEADDLLNLKALSLSDAGEEPNE